jgi:hypothetical protein
MRSSINGVWIVSLRWNSAIVNPWQHFGNKKSVRQNKMCKRNRNKAFLQQKLSKIV